MANRSVGRPSSGRLASQIITLLGGLTQDYDFLSRDAIAKRFSISEDLADRLLDSLRELGGSEDYSLPVMGDEGDPDLALVEGARIRGGRLRLTHPETVALLAAFDRIGVGSDSPVRQAVERSLASPGVDSDEVTRVSAPDSDGSSLSLLAACVEAIVGRRRLEISYRGAADAEARARLIDPVSIAQEDGVFYVDAFDLDRMAERRFRADRMLSAEDAGSAEDHETQREETPRVSIRFDDPVWLEVFDWPGLEILSEEGGSVTASLPRMNDAWIARRLAACGGTARALDAGLDAAMRALAEGLLADL